MTDQPFKAFSGFLFKAQFGTKEVILGVCMAWHLAFIQNHKIGKLSYKTSALLKLEAKN